LTFDLLKRLFSSFFFYFIELWPLTFWNVFSHHLFLFFELWPLTSWNVFSHHFSVIREIREWAEMGELAMASIKKNFQLRVEFSFRIRNKRMGRDRRVG
jgi:hypothetical protein